MTAPCFSRSRGVLKNEDLKTLDSCDMLEFNFILKGGSDAFEMRFDHEGQEDGLKTENWKKYYHHK